MRNKKIIEFSDSSSNNSSSNEDNDETTSKYINIHNRNGDGSDHSSDEQESNRKGKKQRTDSLFFVKSTFLDNNNASASLSSSDSNDSDGSSDQDQSIIPRNRKEEQEDSDINQRPSFSSMPSYPISPTQHNINNTSQNINNNHVDALKTLQFSSTKSVPNHNKNKPALFTMPKVSHGNIDVKIDKDFANFSKYTNGIGLKLMQKMGYTVGHGLGVHGEGRVNPVDVKLRPKGMGLGHGGFDETTADIRKDNKGKRVIDVKEEKEEIIIPWRKTSGKKLRKKVNSKSVKELVQEQVFSEKNPDKIIDMTGKQAKQVSSSGLKDHVTHLPELRYNLQLISDLSHSNLMKHVRELRNEEEKRDAIDLEVPVYHQFVETVKSDISTTQDVIHSVTELQTLSLGLETAGLSNTINVCRRFHVMDDTYYKFGVDAALVSILSPHLKNLFVDWEPLKEPTKFVDALLEIRPWLINNNSEIREDMNAYEHFLYTVWFPKIRSTLSNNWDVYSESALLLLEAWFPSVHWDENTYPPFSLIPFWLYNMIIEQTILPKLKKGIEIWKPSDSISITSWLFPWLPILKSKIDNSMITIRHTIVTSLQNWEAHDNSGILIVKPWREVMSTKMYEGLLTRAVLPKLVFSLRNMDINPANQDIQPLMDVFTWIDHIPNEIFGYLLETEFFKKWLGVLEVWISSPQVNYEQVTSWYLSWKDIFPSRIRHIRHVKLGFKQGLDLMNTGVSSVIYTNTHVKNMIPRQKVQISFKEMVEQHATDRGILMEIQNKVKVVGVTRFVIYSLTKTLGKRGVEVYIDDGVVFVKEGEIWKPTSLDQVFDMIK